VRDFLGGAIIDKMKEEVQSDSMSKGIDNLNKSFRNGEIMFS